MPGWAYEDDGYVAVEAFIRLYSIFKGKSDNAAREAAYEDAIVATIGGCAKKLLERRGPRSGHPAAPVRHPVRRSARSPRSSAVRRVAGPSGRSRGGLPWTRPRGINGRGNDGACRRGRVLGGAGRVRDQRPQ